MGSTVWSVSCLLFFYSRCPPCPANCTSGGKCPHALWSRRLCPHHLGQIPSWKISRRDRTHNAQEKSLALKLPQELETGLKQPRRLTAEWRFIPEKFTSLSKLVKRSITVSEMTNSLHRHYRRFGEKMTEEMGLQTFLDNRY